MTQTTQMRTAPAESGGSQPSRSGESLEGDALTACVGRASAGDTSAFDALHDHFRPAIVRYLRRRTGSAEAAEDLTQQVFLRAWQALPRYQQRGTPFPAWLYRIAHNLMVDYFRSRRPTYGLDGVRDDPRVVVAPEFEDAVLNDELRASLSEAMTHLSPEHREVLTLRFWMDRTTSEIADLVARTEGTVRSTQWRALRALRRELERSGRAL